MKHFLAIFFFLCLVVSLAWAAGSVTLTETFDPNLVQCIKWSWTGDAAGGNVPSTATNDPVYGYLTQVEVVPGTPAPTTLYDFTLNIVDATSGANTVDVLNGAGANMSATVPAIVRPIWDGTNYVYGPAYINNRKVALNLSGSAANSAQGTIKACFQR